MRESIKVGDVIKATSIENCQGSPKPSDLRVKFGTQRGTYFVFLYLGGETNEVPLDAEKRMNELGWFYRKKPMATTTFDSKLAMKKFKERKKKYEGKQIDNSRLYAGSPMHYYCKHCAAPTETLPESHVSRPKTVCDACKLLVEHGLVT